MSRTKTQKKTMLSDYKEKLANSKAVIVIKAKGIKPNESNELKRELFDFGSEYHVVKNTLFKLALDENGLSNSDGIIEGEHAVIFTKEDIVGPSKIIKKFVENTKDKEGKTKAVYLSGYLDKEFLTTEQVSELAEIPEVKGSVAMILGILDNALSGIVNVLEDAPRAYVTVLDQAKAFK